MKAIISITVMAFSISTFCQDSLKMKSIDNLINENEKQVFRIISDKSIPKDTYVSHGELDTTISIYKFSSRNELVEYSQIWVGKKDTGQITSYYFNKEKLIKVITRTPFDSYIQFAYLDNRIIIYAMDNEGKVNLNTDYYLRNYKKILRSAKLKSRFIR